MALKKKKKSGFIGILDFMFQGAEKQSEEKLIYV